MIATTASPHRTLAAPWLYSWLNLRCTRSVPKRPWARYLLPYVGQRLPIGTQEPQRDSVNSTPLIAIWRARAPRLLTHDLPMPFFPSSASSDRNRGFDAANLGSTQRDFSASMLPVVVPSIHTLHKSEVLIMCCLLQSFGRTVVWCRLPSKTGGYPAHLIF